jgi:hypothetical protein
MFVHSFLTSFAAHNVADYMRMDGELIVHDGHNFDFSFLLRRLA